MTIHLHAKQFDKRANALRACRLTRRRSRWRQRQQTRRTDLGTSYGMPDIDIDFNAPNLGKRIETLNQYEIDQLPFGVILLNREGTVLYYSATEACLSGYGESPVGRNMFEISACMGSDNFRGRVTRAMEQGPVDLE